MPICLVLPCLSKMASPIEPSDDMDITPDTSDCRMCAITCPLCQKRFVLSIVFNSHLLGHISYYHQFVGDNNIPNKPFSCTICPFEHEDIFEVSNHIETLHATKYRICSIRAQQMIANDERERSQIISLLGRFDKPTIPLYIRFNYWD